MPSGKSCRASAKLNFDGESREYLKSSQALYWTFFGALLIVFLVLAAQFESFTLPFVIMTTVPLAIVGAIVGLWLYGMSINIFSQIAIVMLVGLAAKNGVLIVEFANQLRDRGVEFVEAVKQASLTRLRPVLMTSLCSAFRFDTAAARARRGLRKPPVDRYRRDVGCAAVDGVDAGGGARRVCSNGT